MFLKICFPKKKDVVPFSAEFHNTSKVSYMKLDKKRKLPNKALSNKRSCISKENDYDDVYENEIDIDFKLMNTKEKLEFLDNQLDNYQKKVNIYTPFNMVMVSTVISTYFVSALVLLFHGTFYILEKFVA